MVLILFNLRGIGYTQNSISLTPGKIISWGKDMSS